MSGTGYAVGKRRLGAIMFTDIVGYSSMTSANEIGALKLFDVHRRVLQRVFSRHGERS